MATATKKAPVKKVPAKVAAPAKKVPAKATANPKTTEKGQRGRQRDVAEESRILKEILGNVTIDGEGVRARVTGIGEAAAGITLDSGKALDNTRAKMILLRHLAEKAGETVNPTPKNIVALRETRHLSWAQIDAMTGTSRSRTLALYDEGKGEEGAWRKVHLVSRDGGEGIRPKSERAPSAKKSGGSRAAVDGEPVFNGEESRDEIVKKVEGKNITWNGSGKMEGNSFKAKVVGNIKVGKNKNDERVLSFSDGDKSRTVNLTSIVKVGGR